MTLQYCLYLSSSDVAILFHLEDLFGKYAGAMFKSTARYGEYTWTLLKRVRLAAEAVICPSMLSRYGLHLRSTLHTLKFTHLWILQKSNSAAIIRAMIELHVQIV